MNKIKRLEAQEISEYLDGVVSETLEEIQAAYRQGASDGLFKFPSKKYEEKHLQAAYDEGYGKNKQG